MVFDRRRSLFTYPIHFHPEYEITFIHQAKGGRRVVGDHIDEIDDYELVMVGPNLYHGWENFNNTGQNLLHEITIQFPADLFEGPLLSKNLFKPVRDLLDRANRGVLFSRGTTRLMEMRFFNLVNKQGFDAFLEFQGILFDLSLSGGQKVLSNMATPTSKAFYHNEQIEKLFHYVNTHYGQRIRLEEAASLLNMSVVSFSRLIKQRTGKSFVDFVNEIRLGFATRLLIETGKRISEICFECGFNNISNFNRTFKRKHGSSPTDFREKFSGVKTVF